MTGGWLKKRLGVPKVITANSEFMGTTVEEWQKRTFNGFGKNFSVENRETSKIIPDNPNASGTTIIKDE